MYLFNHKGAEEVVRSLFYAREPTDGVVFKLPSKFSPRIILNKIKKTGGK